MRKIDIRARVHHLDQMLQRRRSTLAQQAAEAADRAQPRHLEVGRGHSFPRALVHLLLVSHGGRGLARRASARWAFFFRQFAWVFNLPARASQRHAIFLGGIAVTQPTLLSIEVPLTEIVRKPTLGRAIEYCAELAGYSYEKELEKALNERGVKVDNTQLTRWKQGGEGIKWEKFAGLMDVCGNDAPLLWMNHARGWDVRAMRRRKSETERELRLAREEIVALRRVLAGAPA